MALIKCPECGKEVSDKASSCPNCGCPLEKNKTVDAINDSKGKKSKKKTTKKLLISIGIVIVLIFIGTVIYYIATINERTYKSAKVLFNANQYEEAYAAFSEIEDYKDSMEMAKECLYLKAQNLFENKNFEEALIIYSELGEYDDSQKFIAECEKEIGMMSNADYSFLESIEESILNRMDTTSNKNFDRLTIVNTELSYVGQFEDATFYDSNLQSIAKKYIEGLKLQKESLNKEIESDYQIEWQRGLTIRYEALKRLYEDYEFLVDNKEFVGTYISKYEDEKKLLDAYDAIEADIIAQLLAEDFLWNVDLDDYTFSCTIKNNTEYIYSTVFEVSWLDSNNTIFESNSAVIENIQPGQSYKVSMYVSDPYKIKDFTWQNYYTDVKY